MEPYLQNSYFINLNRKGQDMTDRQVGSQVSTGLRKAWLSFKNTLDFKTQQRLSAAALSKVEDTN